jgi:outer membrane lipoprotein-sorting protein
MTRSKFANCTVLLGVSLLFLAAAGVAASADEAADLVKKMSERAMKVPFSGRQITVLQAPRGEALTSERLVSSDGQGRFRIEYVSPRPLRGEVLCYDGKVFWHMIPREKEVRRWDKPQQSIYPTLFQFVQAIELVKARLDLEKDDSVAGRRARVVTAFLPLGRHAEHRFWIDAETYVPLKIEDYGPRGERISQSFFAEIDFAPRFREGCFEFVPPPGAVVQDWSGLAGVEEAARRLGFRPLLPRRLPPGLVVRGWDIVDLSKLQMKALALRIGGDATILLTQISEKALRDRTGHHFGDVLRELEKDGTVWLDRGVVVVLRSDAPSELLDHFRRDLR